MSHGHYDHGGGLAAFLALNDRARPHSFGSAGLCERVGDTTCHCTGEAQYAFMKQFMPRLHYLACWDTVVV